jgi:pimeloyl-ACP methyl ester carboxylesterase
MRPTSLFLVATLSAGTLIARFAHAQATGSADSIRVRAGYEAGLAALERMDREHGHQVAVNGIRMHYLEWGSRDGVPLIWLHGSAGSGYEVRALAPRLAALGYRVIAPSYRGHGQTRAPSYEFSLYDIADDLLGLLDSLHITQAVFGGSSKGGFVAAAVYDQYPTRVSGLLLADGGSWSNQWDFDHHGLAGAKRQVAGGGPPRIVGDSRFDVFRKLAGAMLGPGAAMPPADGLIDIVVKIGQEPDGQWAFMPGFEQMMGSPSGYLASATAPSTLPLLQWSQHAMIPMAVFRRLAVPMMIIDPQQANDELPVTDQNQRLAAAHPAFVVHKIYPETSHNLAAERPEWFLRDAGELLARVKAAPPSGR